MWPQKACTPDAELLLQRGSHLQNPCRNEAAAAPGHLQAEGLGATPAPTPMAPLFQSKGENQFHHPLFC